MATVPSESVEKLAEGMIKDVEHEDAGILETWFKFIKRVTLERIIKGFMTGIGVFAGSLVCHYYVLPHLDLQFYSLFLIKLHKV